MARPRLVVDERINHLVVIEVLGPKVGAESNRTYLALCDCGEKIVRTGHALRYMKSCPKCSVERRVKKLSPERATVNGNKEALYGAWFGMKQRCENKNAYAYSRYGGRGISVCAEWQDYLTFKRWALANGYALGLHLDRVDPHKGYSPDNCEYVSHGENTRRARAGYFWIPRDWRNRIDHVATEASWGES